MRIYTDGSCREGHGGWAWWVDEETNNSGYEQNSTNQRMELMAALEAVNEFYDIPRFTIISDSAYLVNCFHQKWHAKWQAAAWIIRRTGQPVSNRDIWEPLIELVLGHGKIEFEKVKGHSGVHGNEMADQLALAEVKQAYANSNNRLKGLG